MTATAAGLFAQHLRCIYTGRSAALHLGASCCPLPAKGALVSTPAGRYRRLLLISRTFTEFLSDFILVDTPKGLEWLWAAEEDIRAHLPKLSDFFFLKMVVIAVRTTLKTGVGGHASPDSCVCGLRWEDLPAGLATRFVWVTKPRVTPIRSLLCSEWPSSGHLGFSCKY